MIPAITAKVRSILDSYTGVNEDPDNPREEYVVWCRWLLGEATDDELLRMFPDFTPALRPKKRRGVRVVVGGEDGSEREVRL